MMAEPQLPAYDSSALDAVREQNHSPSYVFQNIRSVVYRGTVSWRLLVLGAALALVLVMVSWFSRACIAMVCAGLIARYSSETLN